MSAPEEIGKQSLTSCYRGDFDGVRSSVNSGASVDFQDEEGDTPAMKCCINGHAEILKYLIDN